MKTILASLLLIGTISAAQAAKIKCPATMKAVLTCKATPQPGDYEMAEALIDQAVVCSTPGSSNLSMIISSIKEPKPEVVPTVTRTERAGATSFEFFEQDVKFSLSQQVSRSAVNGRFTIYFPNEIHPYVSMTCK